jgi:hypothetical protein
MGTPKNKSPSAEKAEGLFAFMAAEFGKRLVLGWFVEPTHRGSAGETDVAVLRRHENDRSPLAYNVP